MYCFMVHLLGTVCFYILLSVSITALPWPNLFHIWPDKRKTQPEFQSVQSCPLKFSSLPGAPNSAHKTQLSQKASCFWELWLTLKEFSVSRFPRLKYKQMNGSCCKSEIFTHSGPHLGDPEINESDIDVVGGQGSNPAQCQRADGSIPCKCWALPHTENHSLAWEGRHWTQEGLYYYLIPVKPQVWWTRRNTVLSGFSLCGKFQGESKGGKMIYNIFPIRCRLKNGKVVSLSLSCSADLVWGRRAALTPRKLIFLYGDMSCDNLIDARVLQYLGAPVKFGVEMPLFCHFSLQMWKIRRLHWLLYQ